MLSEPTVRPRHRIRAYGRVVKASGEAEYKRFLDFLSASTSTEKTVLLSGQDNKPKAVHRETSQSEPVFIAAPTSRHSRGWGRPAQDAGSDVINFAPDAHSASILANRSEQITNQLAGELSNAQLSTAQYAPQFSEPSFGYSAPVQSATNVGPVQSPTSPGGPVQPATNYAGGTEAVPRFATHLAADFASQMAAEFQKMAVDAGPISMVAVVAEPEQEVFTIESVSLLEEPLIPAQSVRVAESFSPAETLSALQMAVPASEPEQFLSQAANMLEEWFGKLGAGDDEASDDNELVDGPTGVTGLAGGAGSKATTLSSSANGLSSPASGLAGISTSGLSGLAASLANGTAAGTTEGATRSSGSLISRLGRISPQELNAIRENSAPRQKSTKRTPPTRASRNQGRKHWLRPSMIPMDNGNRKELYASGAAIVKDAVGRVCEVSAANGASLAFSYDPEGHLNGFVRSNVSGKVHSTGSRDKHGVVVRDTDGRVRAQGESMSVDPRGCLSIRRFDGQFWSLDLVRGIHLERRILQDLDGQWNSLTALLTSDGFRMVTRFQKLSDATESYRRYGDWLSSESSKFRFYGRDGSVIQFDSDEDLQSLRPARIWPPGSRPIDEEWQGIRQAGTAWDSVHQYVSQYLSTL